MAKNMTRKGLAVGAALALAGSGLAALPAQAAPAITVALASGTSYNMISGEKIDLKVYGNSEYTWTNASDVKWEIVNSDEVTVTATTNNAGGSATTGATESPSATSATITVDGGTSGTTAGANRLGVAVPADKATSLTVRAYIELDGTDGATSGDLISNAVTVNFIKPADVVASVTITQPSEDDTTIKAAFSTNVNNEQLLNTDFAVEFLDGRGDALAGATAAADALAGLEAVKAPAAWDEDDFFVATSGAVTALDKDTAVSVNVYYNDGGILSDKDLTVDAGADADVDNDFQYPVGQDANETDVNSKIGSGYIAVSALTTGTVTLDTVATATSNAADKFAAGDSSVTISAVVKDAAGDEVSGATVKFDLSANTTNEVTLGADSDDKSITINGTKYTDVTKLPGDTGIDTVSVVTDSDGVAKLVISTANFANNDKLKIDAKRGTKAATQLAVTANTLAYDAYITNANDYVQILSGGSAVLEILVVDQFGTALPSGYDARARYQSSANFTATGETDSSADSDTAAAISGGRASLGVTPDGRGTGTTVYDIDIQKRAAGNSYENAIAEITTLTIETVSAFAVANTIDLDITEANYGDDADTAVIELADADGDSNTDADSDGTKTNDPQALELADFINFRALDVRGATVPTLNAGFALDLKVTQKATLTAAAVNAANQLVTISSDAGDLVMFVVDQDQDGDTTVEKTYGSTVSAYTDNAGNLDLDVHSNKAGKVTITIASGAATQLVELTFAGAASTTGTSLVIDAPDYAAPGSTVIAKASVTDKYGNPVVVSANSNGDGDISLTYDGPGLAVTASADATDSSGVAQLAYFLGSNDSGTITITAKYDADGDENYTDTGDLVVTKTITIGEAPAPAADTKVNAGSFKGYVAIYAKGHEGKRLSAKVGKDWVVVPALASNFVRVVEYTGAGYTIAVRIYIDRVLVDTITVTTK